MKEKIFFKVIEYIDDELISEAAEYRPDMDGGVILNEDEAYGVSTNVVRTRRLWKYPVTVMALLGIVGGAVFIINYSGIIIDNVGAATDTEDTELTVNTGNDQVFTDTEKTVDETINTTISETTPHIVPIKITGQSFYRGVFLDSYPEVPLPDIENGHFIEMSIKDLFEYYNFPVHNNILNLIDKKELVEVTNENTHHGIYILPDGSIYDINTFTFEATYDSMYHAKRFTFTVGKESTFGQAYYKCYDEALKNPQLMSSYIAFYNEEKDILFSIRNVDGITYMFSGTVDEIAGVDRMVDLEMKESYKKYDNDFRNSCEGLPAAIEKFCQTKRLWLYNCFNSQN